MNDWLDRGWHKLMYAVMMDLIRTVLILLMVNSVLTSSAQEFLFGKGGFGLWDAFVVLFLLGVLSWGSDNK